MTHNKYALSTVAMTVYNYLAAYDQLNFDRLVHLVNQQHPGIKSEKIKDAINKLENKRLIIKEGEISRLFDEIRRPVIYRNREDWSIDEDTGEVLGGWSGWVIRDECGKLANINDIFK